MARFRAFVLLMALLIAATASATDWRLVVSSDDPSIRKASSLAIFEGSGRLSKNDRITSITFSAEADAKSNCLVSLDPASGKAELALSPDVEVFKGKVMVAGSKPTRKVIPGHLEIDVPVASGTKDGKLSSVMKPIIQQVNNLPWLYIGAGAFIFLFITFLMNRRSQQYTTSMSKEAKNLYLETVARITERLEAIETNQRNLVKNPPVVRSFRAQIEDFEARLNRIESIAKQGREDLIQATQEFAKSSERYQNLTVKMDEAKAESINNQKTTREHAEALRQEMTTLIQNQEAFHERLANQESEHAQSQAAHLEEQQRILSEMEQSLAGQMRTARAAQDANIARFQSELGDQFEAMKAEIAVMRSNQESLLAMPAMLSGVAQGLDRLPEQFDSVRSSMPDLSSLDSKLDGMGHWGEGIQRIQESLDSLPAKLPNYDANLDSIQTSLLREIEGLGKRIEDREANLSEFLTAHSAEMLMPAVEETRAESKPSKKSKEKKVAHEEPATVLEVEMEVEEPAMELAAAMETEVQAEEPVAELEQEVTAVEVEESAAETELIEEPSVPEVETEEQLVSQAEPILEEEVAPEPELLVSEEVPEAEEQDVVLEPEAEVEPELEPVAEVEEPEADFGNVQELNFRYPDAAPVQEFTFSNAIKKMKEEEAEVSTHVVEEVVVEPVIFHLDELPDHLDTFEDEESEAPVLETVKEVADEKLDPLEEQAAVEGLLNDLSARKPEDELAQFDSEPEPEEDAHSGHWGEVCGNAARTWSSESSRPLHLVEFEGELKPLTPIETAPSGAAIGSIVYGYGRVLYSCGSNIHAFWPGREDRVFNLDSDIPSDEWRLAIKGQSLFVAEQNKVRVLSLQGWYALEQFAGSYRDQLLTDSRWVGLREQDGQAVLDFRDLRGAMAKEGVIVDRWHDGLKLCAGSKVVFAGIPDGRVLELSEFGSDELGSGEGELFHLMACEERPLAAYRMEHGVEVKWFGDSPKSHFIEGVSSDLHPILMGKKLHFVDLTKGELVTLDLKKMSEHRSPAFQGVSEIRHWMGIQHRSHQSVLAITQDVGKKSGRLVLHDTKTGNECTFGNVGQAKSSLIVADHHLVLASSSSYQNVIRVLEPFGHKAAA